MRDRRIWRSGRRNLHQSLQDEGPEDGFGTEDFAARALAQIFFSDSNESLGAASNHQRGSRNREHVLRYRVVIAFCFKY